MKKYHHILKRSLICCAIITSSHIATALPKQTQPTDTLQLAQELVATNASLVELQMANNPVLARHLRNK